MRNFVGKRYCMEKNKGEIVVYQPDAITRLDVRIENDNVWLNRIQLAVLFGRDIKTIGKHISNALKEELNSIPTVANFATVQKEGTRYVERQIEYYNLDMILSVGYRVKSEKGILFRRWANQVLKDYLWKGYSVNNRMRLLESHVDESVLLMLSKRDANVSAEVRTGRLTKDLQLDLQRHNAQYSPIALVGVNNVHDRFLIVDDVVYHLGASLKDLGKKLFAFSRLSFSPSMLL